MLHTFSPQYNHYTQSFLQQLKVIYKQTNIQEVYFSERCYQILVKSQRIKEVDLFGCGYKKIYHRDNISPYLKLQKIVLVANIDEVEFVEIDQVEYLFPEVFLLTLQTTNIEKALVLKNSPLRKSLKAIKQLNLNFFTYLDNAHFISRMQKSFLFKNEQQKLKPYEYKRLSTGSKLNCYRSFLLSYPKFYQYQLHYLKSSCQSYGNLVKGLESQLKQSLQILQKHEGQCKNFEKVSSPKIKCLLLSREVLNDFISPLVYGYLYGPLCQQFINRQSLIEGAELLSCKGKMYNQLFQKQFDQSAQYIQAITKDKTVLQGPYESNYFYKAKHIIITYEDPSPIQLALHISSWKQTRHYGQNRIRAAILQQNIANRKDEFDRKVSNGDAVKQITDWILKASQQQAQFITEDEYLKLAILAETTGKLWFFHRNSLKKSIQNQQNKNKYQFFLNRLKTIPTHNLRQKHQPLNQQRSQLYRHQPALIPLIQSWLEQTLGLQGKQNKQSIPSQKRKYQFDKISINDDISKNRQVKLVILIDGMVGYNQLALMKRMIKTKTDKQVVILAESYCNSQQYADYLMRP